tara:strand:- start:430 stop:1881 length:1452 start_codon:yes stop_codon:yes gene_type:complete
MRYLSYLHKARREFELKTRNPKEGENEFDKFMRLYKRKELSLDISKEDKAFLKSIKKNDPRYFCRRKKNDELMKQVHEKYSLGPVEMIHLKPFIKLKIRDLEEFSEIIEATIDKEKYLYYAPLIRSEKKSPAQFYEERNKKYEPVGIDSDTFPTFDTDYFFYQPDHAVEAGYMSQETWDKIKYNATGRKKGEPLKRLTTKEDKNFRNWQKWSGEKFESGKIRDKNQKSLNKWFLKKLRESNNLVENPRYEHLGYVEHELQILCEQMYLLHKFPELNLERQENFGIKYEDLIKAYPLMSNPKGQMFLLTDIIFKFRYGPNALDYSKAPSSFNNLRKNPHKVYLIRFDLGLFFDCKSSFIYKVGITKKPVADGTSKSRFKPIVAKHIDVLREKDCTDGVEAYTYEQKLLRDSEQIYLEKLKIANLNTKEHKHIHMAYMTDEIETAWRKAEKEKIYAMSNMGTTEWVYDVLKEKEILERFDFLTSF